MLVHSAKSRERSIPGIACSNQRLGFLSTPGLDGSVHEIMQICVI